MLLQSGAMVAKKLLVDDKITAWVKQICLLGVKFSIGKHCLVKHCIFFEERLLSIFKIVLPVTYCFLMYCWLAQNQLSWNVLVLSSNLIGQLCLNGPGYSGRTVIQCTTTTPIRPRGGHTIKQITCNITDSILETLQHKCLNPLMAVTAKTSRTRLHRFKILQLPQSP